MRDGKGRMTKSDTTTAHITGAIINYMCSYEFSKRAIIASLIVVATMNMAWGQAGEPDDIAAIKETARNYMNSWYLGDDERMKESLHPKLAKRGIQAVTGNKRNLKLLSAPEMISYTHQGYGKGLWRENLEIEVVVLDRFEAIASVKIITPHYYEYLHMAKPDKAWVIINTLYGKKAPNTVQRREE